MMARTMCPRPWARVAPMKQALAWGSAWGVRSPLRYDRKNNLSLPGGTVARAADDEAIGGQPYILSHGGQELPGDFFRLVAVGQQADVQIKFFQQFLRPIAFDDIQQ